MGDFDSFFELEHQARWAFDDYGNLLYLALGHF